MPQTTIEPAPKESASPQTTAPSAVETRGPELQFSDVATTSGPSTRVYLRPKPSDIPAVSVLLGLLIASVLVLSLVIGLTGRAAAPASSTNSGTMSTGAKPATSSSAPAHQTYDPAAPVAQAGNVVDVKLVAKEATISVASGVAYKAWTFNGSVPGPVIRVRQGQTIHFTLQNDSNMPHSIDFHAAQTPWSVNYQSVAPGKSFSFDWKANYPGVFMYHCGTPPVMFHMANGMYGTIIVDPANGWTPAHEYVLVQSEFYMQPAADGTNVLDNNKMMAVMPDFVTFNGYANQYKDAPLTAKPGEKIRLFILNAGPSQFSAFHVIGAILSDVYADGNPANHTVGQQTITIPPGGGAVAELTIPEAGAYPFVTHSFSAASTGATGVIDVK